jgi:hypothetical protein
MPCPCCCSMDMGSPGGMQHSGGYAEGGSECMGEWWLRGGGGWGGGGSEAVGGAGAWCDALPLPSSCSMVTGDPVGTSGTRLPHLPPPCAVCAVCLALFVLSGGAWVGLRLPLPWPHQHVPCSSCHQHTALVDNNLQPPTLCQPNSTPPSVAPLPPPALCAVLCCAVHPALFSCQVEQGWV